MDWTSVPWEVRPELAERFRQVRPFEEAETTLVQALVRRPDRLPRRLEVALRLSLNLAKTWVVQGERGRPVPVGPRLSAFRDRVAPVATRIARQQGDLDPRELAVEAEQLRRLLGETLERILLEHSDRLRRDQLESELGHKKLVLALGGGGGSGWAHLGVLSALRRIRIEPSAVVGCSMGAVVALLRARGLEPETTLQQAFSIDLRFKDLFRGLGEDTRYSLPGAIRLHLRASLARHFVSEDGTALRISDLELPYAAVVTGIRRAAVADFRPVERELLRQMRRGTLGRLVHYKDLVSSLARLLTHLASTPGALSTVALGADDLTREFDAVDAAGFSSALPAVLQYDVQRDEPRMHRLLAALFEREGITALADGGLVSNVPARVAWEMVQSGRVGSRNALVVGLDCFAPGWNRNVAFLPLQRIAAENVARDRAFAQSWITFRRVPGPLAVVPQARAIRLALRHSRSDLERWTPFLLKMLEPLPLTPSST